jgi:chloramphenicol-sensitive protein RarD
VICGIGAFTIWGVSPIYWKQLEAVPALEILMHRVIWSLVFLLVVVAGQKSWQALWEAFCRWQHFGILILSAIILGSNWFVFVWAVNNDRVLDTSLGYYINPLVVMTMGMVFLRERLRILQVVAVFLAVIAVGSLTINHGQLPWVSLFLAFSFACYGLIHKLIPVGVITGLTAEMILLYLPAQVFVAHWWRMGQGTFGQASLKVDLFLAGSALVTALPLLLFTIGAKRLTLCTVGFLQYLAPTFTFLSAVFLFHEPFTQAHLWAFLLIWIALILYSTDSTMQYKSLGNLRGD